METQTDYKQSNDYVTNTDYKQGEWEENENGTGFCYRGVMFMIKSREYEQINNIIPIVKKICKENESCENCPIHSICETPVYLWNLRKRR